MEQSIEELGLGQYTNLITAKESDPLLHLLELFLSKRIFSIPIMNDKGDELVGVFEKYDVLVSFLFLCPFYFNFSFGLKKVKFKNM
jgi:CBS domain-containing protein